MVLPDAQAVRGNAGVLPAVERLGHVDLQSAVLMNHIRVAAPNAGLTVFEPTRRGFNFPNVLQTSHARKDTRETHQVIVGIGEPKEEQWSKAGLLVMTLYTWLGGVRTLGASAMSRGTKCPKCAFVTPPPSLILLKKKKRCLLSASK